MLQLNTALSSAATNAASSASSTANSSSGLPSSQSLDGMFLQLLVAQLQNQDPLDPVDPSQFVGQLAQFSELSEVTSIYQLMQEFAGTSSTSTDAANGSAAMNGFPAQNVLRGPTENATATTVPATGVTAAPTDGFSQLVQQALSKIQGGH